MPRIFKIVSVIAHVVVVGFALVAELTAIGPLPSPRHPLSFESIPIRVIDIPLPAPPRRIAATEAPTPSTGPVVAPIVAPTGVQPEPPSGGNSESSAVPTGAVAGFGTGVGLTPIETVPPPAPPPPAPRAPVHVTGIQTPRKLVHVDPAYPNMARMAHIEGVVILETTLDAKGRVVDVRVLRSVGMLDQAAIDAVRQWIYTPTLLNGTPVPIVMTVTVNFKLSDR